MAIYRPPVAYSAYPTYLAPSQALGQAHPQSAYSYRQQPVYNLPTGQPAYPPSSQLLNRSSIPPMSFPVSSILTPNNSVAPQYRMPYAQPPVQPYVTAPPANYLIYSQAPTQPVMSAPVAPQVMWVPVARPAAPVASPAMAPAPVTAQAAPVEAPLVTDPLSQKAAALPTESTSSTLVSQEVPKAPPNVVSTTPEQHVHDDAPVDETTPAAEVLSPKAEPEPELPKTFAQEMGDKAGVWVTRYLEENPQWEEKIKSLNIDAMMDNPESILNDIRAGLNRSFMFRRAKPFIRRGGNLITKAVPEETRPAAKEFIQWLTEPKPHDTQKSSKSKKSAADAMASDSLSSLLGDMGGSSPIDSGFDTEV